MLVGNIFEIFRKWFEHLKKMLYMIVELDIG